MDVCVQPRCHALITLKWPLVGSSAGRIYSFAKTLQCDRSTPGWRTRSRKPGAVNEHKPDIVLVGAGHAHLHVTAHARDLLERANVCLVDPGDFWYSGLATGMLGGTVDPADDRVSVARLAGRAGVRHVRSRVAAIDPENRCLVLGDGTSLSYDLASFNVGSEIDTAGLAVEPGQAWRVKPIANLEGLRSQLEHMFASGRRPRVVVVGGGQTGCEIAASIDGLARRHRARAEVWVLTSRPALLHGHGKRARKVIDTVFARRGIARRTNAHVTAVRSGTVDLRDGSRLECDVAVLATGLRAPSLLDGLPSACRGERGLRVDATLRCSGDASLFGAGDCITFGPRALPALGVYGVRQAPVLLHNLIAAVSGTNLRTYHPQRRTLSILNLGDDRGLALWGELAWHGRMCLRLKNGIDRRFLAHYR